MGKRLQLFSTALLCSVALVSCGVVPSKPYWSRELTTTMNLEYAKELTQHGSSKGTHDPQLILKYWENYPYTEIPEYLLESCVDVNSPLADGNSLLMYACGFSNSAYLAQDKFFDLFLREGADVNYVSTDGLTAIDCAAQNGDTRAFDILLECGARVTEQTLSMAIFNQEDYKSPMRCYIAQKVLKLLQQDGGSPCSSLVSAALMGNSDVVVDLLQDGSHQAEIQTLFVPCCISAFCNEKAMEAVWNYIDDPTAVNTLLYTAAWFDNADVVPFLMERCPYERNGLEYLVLTAGALKTALLEGSSHVAKHFADLGTTLDIQSQGFSPEGIFNDIAYAGEIESAKLMLERYITPKDVIMLSAIQTAAKNGQSDFVKFLVDEVKVDPNLGAESCNTAISEAAGRGNLELVQWLYEHGSHVDGCISPINAAADGNHLDVIQYLHETCGADINGITRHSDGSGASALTRAIEGGYLDVISYLVEHGADTNSIFIGYDMESREPKYESALTYAKKWPSKNIISYLTSNT